MIINMPDVWRDDWEKIKTDVLSKKEKFSQKPGINTDTVVLAALMASYTAVEDLWSR